MNPNELMEVMTAVIGHGGGMNALTANTITSGTVAANAVSSYDKPNPDIAEGIMDKYSMNKVVVDHKLQGHEFVKLRDTVPAYADEIKENISRNMSREIVKKATFTKKHDKDTDVHHFIGRVWTFTDDELKELIREVRRA